jgi:hypothetical protein
MMRLPRLRLSIFIGVTFYTVEKQNEAAANAISAPPRESPSSLLRRSEEDWFHAKTRRREGVALAASHTHFRAGAGR